MIVPRLLILLSLIFIELTLAQYEIAPAPYSPPATEPTNEMDVYSANEIKSHLRGPPIPKWVEKINQENVENLVIDETTPGALSPEKASTAIMESPIESSGDSSHIKPEGSGIDEGSSDGSGDGSGAILHKTNDNHASGEGGDFVDIGEMLSAMEKQLIDNGIACPSDIIFVLDATSSIKGIYEDYLAYIQKVLEGLDVSELIDHVGVIVYSSEKKHKVKIRLGEYTNRTKLEKAVKDLPFFGGITATGQALQFAAENNRDRRENLTLTYVVLTDGYSYDSIETGANKLHQVPNSIVYAVSIGDSYVKSELEVIGGSPNNVLLGPTSYGTLVKNIKTCKAKLDFQADEEAETVTVRYIPTATDSLGRHLIPNPVFTKDGIVHFNDKATDEQIEAAVKGGGSEVNSIAPTTEMPFLTTDCDYDIGIIFDASGSLIQSFQTQLKLASRLVEQLPIKSNYTRVGIVQFAGKTKTKVLASFKQDLPKSSLLKIINYANFYSGTTYTNQALKLMAKLYKDSYRSSIKKRLLIFTDGYSAEDTSEGIEQLKSLGVIIYTVGIVDGTSLNKNELEEMATSPEHYYDSNHFDDLLLHFPTIKYC